MYGSWEDRLAEGYDKMSAEEKEKVRMGCLVSVVTGESK